MDFYAQQSVSSDSQFQPHSCREARRYRSFESASRSLVYSARLRRLIFCAVSFFLSTRKLDLMRVESRKEKLMPSLFLMRQARLRAQRIRETASRLSTRVLAVLPVTPELPDPAFTFDPDLETFLRRNNLTSALEQYIRTQQVRAGAVSDGWPA